MRNNVSFGTDCGGNSGWSGTGYVDGKGVLVVIHLGSGVLLQSYGGYNFGQFDEKSVVGEWLDPKTICNATTLSLPERYWDGIFTPMNLISRNPRTRVADASVLIALAGQFPLGVNP
jgi:hypothetical protein